MFLKYVKGRMVRNFSYGYPYLIVFVLSFKHCTDVMVLILVYTPLVRF